MSSTNPNTHPNPHFLTVSQQTCPSPRPVRLDNPTPVTATGHIINPTRVPSQGTPAITSQQPRPLEPMILTTPGQVQQPRDHHNREPDCCDPFGEAIRDMCNFCCVLGPPRPRDPQLIPRD